MAVIAIVAASVLGIGVLVALAQSTQSAQRTVGGPRSTTTTAVTPPPLPFGDQSRSAQGGRRSTLVPSGKSDLLSPLARLMAMSAGQQSPLRPYTGPRPPIPKLSDFLHHRVHTRSANGSSIVLTGPLGVAYLEDQTVAYGSLVGWVCTNLQATTPYKYIVFSPDGYAAEVLPFKQSTNSNVSPWTTDNQGRCLDSSNFAYYAFIPLSTPMNTTGTGGGGNNPDPMNPVGVARGGAAGSDAPYSGVWAIAVKNNTTGNFEAVAYTVVLGTLNFNTYSDAGFTTKAADFTSGSNVYVSASGLNPAHFYAFGFVNTSGNGLPCVYTIPSGAQNNANATCFLQGSAGVLPTNGTLTGVFPSPSSGANSVGTYSVQLYDITTNDLISTQQISLNPASVSWSPLVPYNGATTGTNIADTFAVNGILNGNTGAPAVVEESVTGLTYAASGLTTGHNYRVTVSNPNGVVMNSTTSDPQQQQFTQLPTYTAAGGALPATKIDFPVNTTTITSLGQAQIQFAPNVYTAQLYDTTSNAVVGSKSFRMVSYAAALHWTSPAGLFVNANTTATNVTTTVQNTAGILYGSWNADGIKQMTITSDSNNFVTLGLQVGITTATDSSGNVWNLTNPNAHTIVATPAVAGVSLPANGTLPIPMTVADPGVKCGGTGCILRTSILPYHGINPSVTNAKMQNTASNGLLVFASGSGGTVPTYSLAVGAYSGAQLPTPRYNQMMYRTGTNGASGGKYTMTFTITNTGATQAMESAEFALPPGFDMQLTPPTLTSIIVNGVNQTANWSIQAPNPFGGIGTGCDPAVNDFGITTTKNADTLAVGKTAVVTISMPILPTAFPFEEIAGTANYCDSAGIGGTAYQLGQTNTLTNAVAGTTNIDSTELGVFSLDTSLMSATLNPSTIAALPAVTTTFKFVNTSTGLDPNPDYVNELLLTVPAGAIPSSLTITSPNQVGVTWYANPTGTAGQWRIELCTPGPAPCAGTTDSNALPPGAELDVKFNYTAAPTIGTYPIAWSVRGANGNGFVAATAAQQPNLIVANTTAQVSFTYAGGYTANPAYPPVAPILAVPSNAQPSVGSWSNFVNGNGFVYELHNNGSTPITDISIAIPSSNTSGQITDAQDWSVIASSVHVYGSGAQGAQCLNNGYKSLTQPVRGSPGTYGLLMLSGCNVPVNGTIDVFFYALSPYDNGSNFNFPASVANGGVPADPRPPATPNTLPIYSLSNVMHIATDATLQIQVPQAGGNVYNPALFGGSTPSVGCPVCTYTNTLVPVINLGAFTGSVTATDVLAASVYSNDNNGWNLSVAADVNPSPAGGQVSTCLDQANSNGPAGYTVVAAVTCGTYQTVPTVGTMALSSFNGAVRHQPIDNIMSYKVTVGATVSGASQVQTVTLTYTLVAN
ncbi:MAG: hypothetical protein JO083_07455 [Candidatus Eremiobacteraeota bacterium]|nr:hypothetical protein [Candidatus Eremiobacteraeota bacterium]